MVSFRLCAGVTQAMVLLSPDDLSDKHFVWACLCSLPSFAQDRVGYKTLLDANNLRSTCQHGRPGKWSAIVIQDEYNQSPYEAYEYIYAPVGARVCLLWTLPTMFFQTPGPFASTIVLVRLLFADWGAHVVAFWRP